MNLLVPDRQNIRNSVLRILFLKLFAIGKTISTYQNRHGEGERLYRQEHSRIEIPPSIIPSAEEALQSAAAELTTDSATQDYIQLYEDGALRVSPFA
jgi:hypothetical protein